MARAAPGPATAHPLQSARARSRRWRRSRAPSESEAVTTSASAESVIAATGWPDGGRVLVVGHQPTLGEVAAQLLGGEAGEVSVRKGAILWFATRARGDRTETLLKVVLDPETLEG